MQGRIASAVPNVATSTESCFAHIASTSQGRGFGSVSLDLQGIISMSLLQKPSGATDGLEQCVASVLRTSVLAVDDLPPLPRWHPSMQRLDILLRLCLPGSEWGRRTANRLRELLTGDICESIFRLRVPGGAAAIDLVEWSAEVASLMMPCQIAVFPRH